MCGIIGYIGSKNASEVIINGLKRMEYRGYDSAGIALAAGDLIIKKSVGKLSSLEAIINYDELKSYTTGIGHTRWATHGVPSMENAHPHTDCTGGIVLVHNGIIENYLTLKKVLIREGHVFKSETDTEVVAHLIEMYHESMNLLDSVIQAIKLVEGAYGILVYSVKEPDRIIAIKKGSPLILGIGQGEVVVASDASAIVEHTRSVIYMEDNEIVEVKAGGIRSFDSNKKPVEKKSENIDWEIAAIEKNGYDHFMLKEICEQPETIRNAFRGRIVMGSGNARLDGLIGIEKELGSVKRIVFIACGTSWHAGLIGEYLIEEYARIPVEVEYASEFRYRRPVLLEGDLVVLISQSGETADTLAALREARSRGALAIGITNVVGSTIARESECGVYIHAGPEVGVASTKAFTSQITVIILLTILLARRRHMTVVEAKRILEDLQKAPEHVEKIIANGEIMEIAREYCESRNFLYLGRGVHFPVALEGALKLKEISYIHAEGYPAAEMKHGPIALIDENMPVVFIALKGDIYSKIISNMEQVRARKGRIIAIATEGDDKIHNYADRVIYVPECESMISPLLSVVPLQLLSYYIAVFRGCNVDQPRNLAKSVTVE